MINNENYEGYLMRYADGELSKAEAVEVEAFLERHPELREELDCVSSPTLRVTAPTATMPGKERMMHTEPAFVPLGRKSAVWGAAAAVALFIIAGAVVRSFATSGGNGSVTAGLPQPDSTRQEVSGTVADPIPFDSIYANPAQKPPVFLAENNPVFDTEQDNTPFNAAIDESPLTDTTPATLDGPTLLADNTIPATTRRIVGGTIIVVTDNLVSIEPPHTPSSNPNAIRGYTIENSQLAMEAEKGIIGRTIDAIVAIFSSTQDNDTLLAFNE